MPNKLVRVELTFEEGNVRYLTGEVAAQWYDNAVAGFKAIGHHGSFEERSKVVVDEKREVVATPWSKKRVGEPDV
jgi:hypothetical protein